MSNLNIQLRIQTFFYYKNTEYLNMIVTEALDHMVARSHLKVQTEDTSLPSLVLELKMTAGHIHKHNTGSTSGNFLYGTAITGS